MNWNISIQTPDQILICIFKELYPNFNLLKIHEENSEDSEIHSFQMAWNIINFCVNEYGIYRNYSDYILTVSSVFYALNFKEENFQIKILQGVFEEDIIEIQACLLDIDQKLNETENEDNFKINSIDEEISFYVNTFYKDEDISNFIFYQEETQTIYSSENPSNEKCLGENNNQQVYLNEFVKIKKIALESLLTPQKYDENMLVLNQNHSVSSFSILQSYDSSKNQDSDTSTNQFLLTNLTKNKVSINDKNHNSQSNRENYNHEKNDENNLNSVDIITPVKNSILPGQLFFSNIQNLNFSGCGLSENERLNFYCNSSNRYQHESNFSTAPEESKNLTSKKILNRELLNNKDYKEDKFEDRQFKILNSEYKEYSKYLDSSLVFDGKSFNNNNNNGKILIKQKRKRSINCTSDSEFQKTLKKDLRVKLENECEKENDFYAANVLKNTNYEKYDGESFILALKDKNNLICNKNKNEKFKNRKNSENFNDNLIHQN